MGINQKLLPMKAHYFLFNAGTSPTVPFMPTLARQLGYSPKIVGTIYFVLPIVGMISKPLFGVIADRFKIQKFLFLLFQIVTAIAFFGINFIPSVPSNSELHCHAGVAVFRYCSESLEQVQTCTMNSVVENPSNDTFSCQMNCQITSDEWDTICKNWNIPELCEKANQHDTLKMKSIVIRNQVNKMKECLFFHIHRSIILGKQTSMYCPADNATNKILKSPCEIQCDDEAVMDVITSATDDEVKSSYQFWMFFMFMILAWSGMAVVVSVGDAVCFEMLGDQPQKYGHQRLWGSVGWGTFSIISGLLIDKFSEGHANKNYAIGFYLMLALIAFDVFISSKIKTNQSHVSANIFKDIGKIFTSCRVIVFFLWCILVGLGTAMIWNFLFWHLENLAGCENTAWLKTLQGLVMGIQCFGGELPFFFLSGRILKKIGHVNAMSLVLLGFSVRFFFYSVLENPWWVLPVELLSGVTFGIFYATMASYASIVAPPGTETTMQGLVGAIFEGIGVSFGSFLGGSLMFSVGGSGTFRIFAIAGFICFVCHVVIQLILNKTSGAYGKAIIASNTDHSIKKLNSGEKKVGTEEEFKKVELN